MFLLMRPMNGVWLEFDALMRVVLMSFFWLVFMVDWIDLML